MEISQNFVAFSEYMNFKKSGNLLWWVPGGFPQSSGETPRSLFVDNSAIYILKTSNSSDTLLEFIIIALWVTLWNSAVVLKLLRAQKVRVPLKTQWIFLLFNLSKTWRQIWPWIIYFLKGCNCYHLQIKPAAPVKHMHCEKMAKCNFIPFACY